MPAKLTTIYTCSNCDAQFPKWSGRCLECGAWGTLEGASVDARESAKQGAKREAAKVEDLSAIKGSAPARLATGLKEVDRVLGGGLSSGSLVLLGGEPGIGKSTILMQLCAANSDRCIYASGEESAGQIKERLDRIGAKGKNFKFIGETNVEKILTALEKEKPALAVIDSIQTVYSLLNPGEPGSVNQIRTSAMRFLEIAKRHGISIILTGHITKDGQVAGPKTLEHIVDTVLYLESEKAHDYRILRTTKNRFGSTGEIGIFEMTGEGFREVANPSGIFIDSSQDTFSGSVVSVIMEGTRPFLIEIQALVTKTVFGYPQRKASGFDLNRLQVLAAVLTKRAGLNLTNQDVILNIVGGLKVSDPGVDLAVCLAVASSLLNQTIDRQTVVLGEVGLGGEVRGIGKMPERLREAAKLGYTSALVPPAKTKAKPGEMKLIEIKSLEEMVKLITGNNGSLDNFVGITS